MPWRHLAETNVTEVPDVDSNGTEIGTDELFFLGLMILLLKVLVDVVVEMSLHKWPSLPFNESSVTIILGIILGGTSYILMNAGLNVPKLDPSNFSEVFSVVLLPPIIYAAGFTMKKKDFFKNIGTIMLFCTIGTIVSTIIIGATLTSLTRAGILPPESSGGLSSDYLAQGLVVGAMLSATDPVATLAVFQELNVNKMLYSIVFGESVLNDAIGIVLFKTVLKYSTEPITAPIAGNMIVIFVWEFVGSSLIGLAVVIVSAVIMKRLMHHLVTHHQICIMLISAYLAYIAAEWTELSGIIALFVVGILQSHYHWHSMPRDAKYAMMSTTKVLAYIAEAIVFLSVGFSVFDADFGEDSWDFDFIFITLLLCFASRGLIVFPLSYLSNRCRTYNRIKMKHQLIMWFAGLRGAIALILAFTLPLDFPARKLAVNSTIVVVLVTNIICGPLTRPLVKALNIETGEIGKNQNVRSGNDSESEATMTMDQRPSVLLRPRSQMSKKWRRFDDRYIKPWLGGRGQVQVDNTAHSLASISANEDSFGGVGGMTSPFNSRNIYSKEDSTPLKFDRRTADRFHELARDLDEPSYSEYVSKYKTTDLFNRTPTMTPPLNASM